MQVRSGEKKRKNIIGKVRAVSADLTSSSFTHDKPDSVHVMYSHRLLIGSSNEPDGGTRVNRVVSLNRRQSIDSEAKEGGIITPRR